jgi:hypothetical protein
MSAFNENNPYIAIDGIVLDTEWKEVELTGTMETQDVTQGVGRTGMQRAEGLRDASISIVVGYRTEKIQQQFAMLKPGRHNVVYGPQGNTPGLPKHVQDFIFNDLPLGQNVDKSEVVFSVGGEQADEPTVDMHNGGVW